MHKMTFETKPDGMKTIFPTQRVLEHSLEPLPVLGFLRKHLLQASNFQMSPSGFIIKNLGR